MTELATRSGVEVDNSTVDAVFFPKLGRFVQHACKFQLFLVPFYSLQFNFFETTFVFDRIKKHGNVGIFSEQGVLVTLTCFDNLSYFFGREEILLFVVSKLVNHLFHGAFNFVCHLHSILLLF